MNGHSETKRIDTHLLAQNLSDRELLLLVNQRGEYIADNINTMMRDMYGDGARAGIKDTVSRHDVELEQIQSGKSWWGDFVKLAATGFIGGVLVLIASCAMEKVRAPAAVQTKNGMTAADVAVKANEH